MAKLKHNYTTDCCNKSMAPPILSLNCSEMWRKYPFLSLILELCVGAVGARESEDEDGDSRQLQLVTVPPGGGVLN